MRHEFMSLLPWTLQEEVLRSPRLRREEHLLQAVLAFKLLLHSIELPQTICGPGGSRRFVSGTMVAVTFAEHSVWAVLLNTALALIRFVLDAKKHWSFSRVGTYCLENFFGFVRRESLGDDHDVVASCVILETSLASSVMYDLNLRFTHRGGTMWVELSLGDVVPHLWRSRLNDCSGDSFMSRRWSSIPPPELTFCQWTS
jgi:hypothetical protein